MASAPPSAAAPRAWGFLRRPTEERGLAGWLFTVDHKRIGILYFVTAFAFFLIGGLEAVVLRLQLATPEAELVSPDVYNQLFTMHGLTMIFFAVMPFGSAFFNYLLPLMIGARDVAFPRLNAFSYWVFLAGGLFLYSGVLFQGLPDSGWFNYAPLNLIGPDPGNLEGLNTAHDSRMIFYSVGLQIAGIASLAASVNFIVTILNMRAPGMTLLRMPVFVWMALIVAFLTLFAIPVIGVALWQLLFDVRFGANFFDPAAGAAPILWIHLFWIFGHPEVYILVLPAFGIVSETVPVFSRKPLFGYAAIVFAGIAIGFMGWGVWAHHMFTTGLGPVADSAFSLTTMFIAVATGIKIFNWLGTMWGGRLRIAPPMLWAIGLISVFTLGGISGVTHALVPHNTQQHDTYYVVAHFHYVLFGGAVFGVFAGLYYWFPKVTGRMLNEGLGAVHFWLTFVGMNLTFFPMHIVGLLGMPRRIDTYPRGFGWEIYNLLETIGAFVIVAGTLVLIGNLLVSARRGEIAGNDPWDARTPEWIVPSPPPHYNFRHLPHIDARDDLWHRKYVDPRPDDPRRAPAEEPDEEADITMPSPSYYPLVAAAGLPIAGWGVLFGGAGHIALIACGLAVAAAGLYGWALEPSVEEPRPVERPRVPAGDPERR